MKPADFEIGLEFLCGPFWYRCTDIGTRTIAAIRLTEDDPVWYEGPPYMLKEIVLDQDELDDAHLSEDDAILASIGGTKQSGHPGFDQACVERMLDGRLADQGYPRDRRLLEFERLRADGEILHPYAAKRDGDEESNTWIIQFFLPFTKEWIEMPELEFIQLPRVKAQDIVVRAKRISE